MRHSLAPVVLPEAACKCCGESARLAGVVDFHKNCEEARTPHLLEPAGVPVYYHRCDACGFLFTTAFDDFTTEDFARWVYNDGYAIVDPDYLEIRPAANAALIADAFGNRTDLKILDYGGGNGALAERLRRFGFASVDTYDPFVAGHAQRPTGPYDLIVSFEVMEHAPEPRITFDDIDGLLAADGLLLFSTLLQPDGPPPGVGWWYVAPRNGHVSIHSRASILKIVSPAGYTFGSFTDNLHVLFRRVPDFATHLLSEAA